MDHFSHPPTYDLHTGMDIDDMYYGNLDAPIKINWLIPLGMIAVAALLIACLAMGGFISFRDNSVPDAAFGGGDEKIDLFDNIHMKQGLEVDGVIQGALDGNIDEGHVTTSLIETKLEDIAEPHSLTVTANIRDLLTQHRAFFSLFVVLPEVLPRQIRDPFERALFVGLNLQSRFQGMTANPEDNSATPPGNSVATPLLGVGNGFVEGEATDFGNFRLVVPNLTRAGIGTEGRGLFPEDVACRGRLFTATSLDDDAVIPIGQSHVYSGHQLDENDVIMDGGTFSNDKRCFLLFTQECTIGNNLTIQLLDTTDTAGFITESVAYTSTVGNPSKMSKRATTTAGTDRNLVLTAATGSTPTTILPGSYLYLKRVDNDKKYEMTVMFLIGGAQETNLQFEA